MGKPRKVMSVKVCKRCGNLYETPSKRSKICPKCKYYPKKK